MGFVWINITLPSAFPASILQVIEVIRHPHDKAESKYNPEAVSKEDEERYQKMLCENEELQRLIVQVRVPCISTYIQKRDHMRQSLISFFIFRLTERR